MILKELSVFFCKVANPNAGEEAPIDFNDP
jgi:hypothetical protein